MSWGLGAVPDPCFGVQIFAVGERNDREGAGSELLVCLSRSLSLSLSLGRSLGPFGETLVWLGGQRFS